MTSSSLAPAVCVCDDDQAVLDAVAAVLQTAGYRVLLAHEHKELETALRDEKPDLLILDVRMPGHDGFWVAEGLHALGSTIPIIFMTAYDRWIYRLYAPFVGAAQYLVKPVDPRVLLGKVEKLLARKQPQRKR